MGKDIVFKVRLRNGFSDRNGIKTENTKMQFKNLDGRTRTGIINIVDKMFNALSENIDYNGMQRFLRCILEEVYCQEIQYGTSSYSTAAILDVVKITIRNDDYDSVFTIIEYLVQRANKTDGGQFCAEEKFNELFQKEYVGYRFMDEIIIPITDENEVNAIGQAKQTPYDVVNLHISKATEFLANRDNPDYENSIKESISAVEAICEVITGIKGKEANLGSMLKKIEESGTSIHGALKSAFNILYGYTSDANGIRHAGDIGGPSSTFEEAKFMLVSCSAFINYLIGVSAK